MLIFFDFLPEKLLVFFTFSVFTIQYSFIQLFMNALLCNTSSKKKINKVAYVYLLTGG